MVTVETSVEERYAGPVPHPQHLRQLEEIFPGAARMIFESFVKQNDHRIKMEELVVKSNVRHADVGQWIGGTLGFTGLVGSLILGGMGFVEVPIAIAGSSLLALVSVFVVGRKEEAKERATKKRVQAEVEAGRPIEKIQQRE